MPDSISPTGDSASTAYTSSAPNVALRSPCSRGHQISWADWGRPPFILKPARNSRIGKDHTKAHSLHRHRAMRQRILGSHMPPCHRRMVITTQFNVLPCCTAAQTSSGTGGGGGLHEEQGLQPALQPAVAHPNITAVHTKRRGVGFVLDCPAPLPLFSDWVARLVYRIYRAWVSTEVPVKGPRMSVLLIAYHTARLPNCRPCIRVGGCGTKLCTLGVWC